jgi:multiple sugar transport system permease protein
MTITAKPLIRADEIAVGAEREISAATAKSSRHRWWTYGWLTVAAALTLLPFIWMGLGSFKSQGEILRHPNGWIPSAPTLANYRRWFGEFDIQHYFVNSLVVAVVTVLGNLVFCSMVGYALAKLAFPGKRLIFSMVMLTLMVPGVVTFIPLFVMVSRLGLVNTFAGLVLPFLTGPMGVFLMRQFMMDIPDSLIEAARIDGAGEIRIFANIVIPLCKPPLATLTIFSFLGSWNSFLWPLVVAQNQDKYTLPVALSLFSTGEHATDYGLLLAGSVLVITPIVVLFVALQRYFVQSVAATGVK